MGEDKCRHLVYSCLLGRLDKDPSGELLGQLDGEVRNFLTGEQCPVPEAADRGREEIDFGLLFSLGMLWEDPDFESMKEFFGPGVRIGVDTQLKRTSTVLPAKRRWALGEMDSASLQQLNDNYPSAREHAGLLQEDIAKQIKMGFIERMTYGEALKRFSMLRFLVLCPLVKTPFRWDKTRSGVQADFVGYFFGLAGKLGTHRRSCGECCWP